jgi:aspartate/glutamate racemase
MKKGRCLGLVGGLGVGATIHYYGSLAQVHAERGYRLNIVIAHAETEQIATAWQTTLPDLSTG